MSAYGLPTPENTPGPDSNRLIADKVRQDEEKGSKVIKFMDSTPPAKPTPGTNTETTGQLSAQSKPPSEEAAVDAEDSDTQMEDTTNIDTGDNTLRQRNTINRIENASKSDNYYEVLGLKPGCTPDDVKKAYRENSRIVHPDKSGDGEANENYKSEWLGRGFIKTPANSLTQEVQLAFKILMDEFEMKKAGRKGKTAQGSASGNKKPDDFGEDLAPNAFGSEAFDRNEFMEEATPYIENLLSDPNDKAAKEGLKDVETNMRRQLDLMAGSKPKYSTVRIVWQPIVDFSLAAQKHLHSNDVDEETKKELLRTNKESLKRFVEQGGYPASWYQALPPVEEPKAGRTRKSQSKEVPPTGAEEVPPAEAANAQSTKASPQSEASPLATALAQQARSGVRTKRGEPILGYRNVGRGHQFIVQTGSLAEPGFDLRSGAEIGFQIADAYMNKNDEDKNRLGEDDGQYGRQDASRYKGVYGVASKPLQTKTVGASRLPTAWVLVGFDGDTLTPNELVWLTRTNLRKICGKGSADEDIRSWYEDRGEQPVDQIPPRIVKHRVTEEKSSVTEEKPSVKEESIEPNETLRSLTAQVEALTKLLMLQQKAQK